MSDILKSKRFWATVSGIAVVIVNQYFPMIPEDTVTKIVAMLAAWVIGDSMRATVKSKDAI